MCVLEVPFDVYRIKIKQQEVLTLKGTTSRLSPGWKGNFSFISFIEPVFLGDRLALLCLSSAGLIFELYPDRWQNLRCLTLLVILKDLFFSILDVCFEMHGMLWVLCMYRITTALKSFE